MAAHFKSTAVLTTLVFLGGTAVVTGGSAQQTDKGDFVRDVQPIFDKSCVMCHGPQTQMAGLRLDAKQSVMAKVVVAGKSDDSALYHRVAGIGNVASMPMGGRLADEQISLIKRWIDEGAKWPDNVGAQVTAAK